MFKSRSVAPLFGTSMYFESNITPVSPPDGEKPCISCADYWVKDEGYNFIFCDDCRAKSGHEQHPQYTNRCRFCVILLRIALHVGCYPEYHGGKKGEDNPAFAKHKRGK